MAQETDTRFHFGKNWLNYLNVVDEAHIENARLSFVEMIEIDSLRNQTFLDIGCGSGLSSLVAYRMGAKKIYSFDYDEQSVEATRRIKARFANNATNWHIEQGSVLDQDYLEALGKFDVVYSWGVLHHTGNMWQAFANVSRLTNDNGLLFIAIYNDQGGASRRWRRIKEFYVKSSTPIKWLLVATIGFWREMKQGLFRLLKGKNPLPFTYWRAYQAKRGMSVWHDLIDWIGGYPFEVATPEAVFKFFHQRGYTLENMKTVRGELGNNQFVFRKQTTPKTISGNSDSTG